MTETLRPELPPTSVGAYTPLEPLEPVTRQAIATDAPWSAPMRVAFRFACAWLVLAFGVDVLGAIPLVGDVAGKLHDLYVPALGWVAAHVLHTAAPAVDLPNGAGDKTIFWTYHACALVLAIVATVLWSALDRDRPHYRVAHDRLRVYVRYTLGASMIGYGIAKLLPSQFPDLQLTRYIEPYGEFSPMGVLWSFMSTSHAYGFFCGAAEATGAVLLFWRRTTTLGALVTASALANVVALNLAYDVTVKGYSILLLLAALFLLAPEVPRLWAVLVRHAAVPAQPLGTTTLGPLPPIVRRVLKPLAVASCIGFTFYGTWSFWHASFRGATPTLWGIYDVERFVQNGAERAPLVTDAVRWRRVVFDRGDRFTVQMMSDSVRRYRVTLDSAARHLTIASPREPQFKAAFAFVRDDAAHVRLAGRVGTDSIELALRRIDHTRFPLVTRGFRWVQDDNYNR